MLYENGAERPLTDLFRQVNIPGPFPFLLKILALSDPEKPA